MNHTGKVYLIRSTEAAINQKESHIIKEKIEYKLAKWELKMMDKTTFMRWRIVVQTASLFWSHEELNFAYIVKGTLTSFF